jgi:hypothetical protein
MSVTKVILVNGKKRAGKDYCAKLLKNRFRELGYKADCLSFAFPLKNIICKSFEITFDELEDLKNDAEEIVVNGDIMTNFRRLLQMFGTEGMKSVFGDSVWVDIVREEVKKSDQDFIIVPDFRFKIEADVGDYTICVKNYGNDTSHADTHASENELNDWNFDFVVDNTGYRDISNEIDDLANKILNV